MHGKCPTCDESFRSKKPKKYCSMRCYTSSDSFKRQLAKNRKKATGTSAMRRTKAMMVICQHCGVEFKSRTGPKNKRGMQKYCSHLCYRRYKAALFDKWIANPEEIALPQCYDEFMTQNELPCLITGCGWKGQHLGSHLANSHGVTAREFKKLAGFNLGTGLVSPELHTTLCETNSGKGHIFPRYEKNSRASSYRSLEGSEHHKKAIAELDSPPRQFTCKWCQSAFMITDPTTFNIKYCSEKCRTKYYTRPRHTLMCDFCGNPFAGNQQQKIRAGRGQPVVCSNSCRASLNQNRGSSNA